MDFLTGSVAVPVALLVPFAIALLLLLAWTYGLARDRNPLPFPDRDYHVFSAASPSGLIALEDLMQHFGHAPRFRIDSAQVDRTVFTNGTIINWPRPDALSQLGDPAGALGFVVRDPDDAAREAIDLLRRNGFQAELVPEAEPGLPIAFVKTDALKSAALVFRKHVLQMGQKPPSWTPRDRPAAKRARGTPTGSRPPRQSGP
jgi:hypothetical protein